MNPLHSLSAHILALLLLRFRRDLLDVVPVQRHRRFAAIE
jgi:hypothetical protein